MAERFLPSDAVSVTVVIPCYNSERHIISAVASAMAQVDVAIEVIVVNDGSTDQTSALLKQFSGRIKIIDQANGGAAVARNRGASEARGDWIVFLDADDFLLPDAISGQLKASVGLAERAFPVGRSLRLCERTGIMSHHAGHDAAEVRTTSLGEIVFNCPLVTAPLYPRQGFIEIGGFDVGLLFREDCDLFVRLILAGWTPQLSDTSTFVYRDHSGAGRVSRTAGDAAAISQRKMFLRWSVLLEESMRKADRGLRQGMARIAWLSARNILRLGDIENSKFIFELARRFDREVVPVGSRPYRILAGVFGELVAEHFLVRAKRVCGALTCL